MDNIKEWLCCFIWDREIRKKCLRKIDELGFSPDFNIKECLLFQELIHSIYIEHLLLPDTVVSSKHTNNIVCQASP